MYYWTAFNVSIETETMVMQNILSCSHIFLVKRQNKSESGDRSAFF